MHFKTVCISTSYASYGGIFKCRGNSFPKVNGIKYFHIHYIVAVYSMFLITILTVVYNSFITSLKNVDRVNGHELFLRKSCFLLHTRYLSRTLIGHGYAHRLPHVITFGSSFFLLLVIPMNQTEKRNVAMREAE